MKKQFYLFYIILFIFLIIYILTKLFVRKNIDLNQSISLIKNILHITRIHNTGALWGIMQNNNLLFIILSLVIIAILFYYFKELTNTRLCSFFTALIFSGAIGNLIDRLLFGFVIDFIDLRFWPVFNIADAALTVGIIGTIFLNLKDKNYKKVSLCFFH